MKTTRPRIHILGTSIAAIVAASFAQHQIQAADGSWNVNASGLWSDTANWTPAAIPGTTAGDVVNLTFNLTAASTVTIDTTSRTVGDLNIGDPTTTRFSYTLAASGGASLILDGAGSNDATIDFTQDIANTISAPITLVDNGVIRSSRNVVMTLSGIISDGGAGKSLTFNNDTNGTVTAPTASRGQFNVNAVNTYSGGTTIDEVRVQASNNASFGTGSVTILNAGQAFLNGRTVANNFSIAGNGWAETAAGNPFGAIRLDGTSILNGTVTLTADAALGGNAGTSTVNGLISGGFTLTKRGASTLILANGSNSYNSTTIQNGTLQLNNNAAAGAGDISLIAGGSGGTRLTINGGVTIANNINAAAVTGVAGTGVIQQTGTGLATVNGAINFTGSPSAGGNFQGGTASAGNALVLNGMITSTVPLTQRDGFVQYNAGGTGYTSLGVTGTAIVGATNGMASTVVVSLGNSGNANLDLNGFNQTLAGITRSGNTAIIGNSSTTTDSTLTTTGTSTYGGTIQDALTGGTRKVSLTVAGGALTLSGTNTYTGATNVTGGLLAVTRTLALAPASDLTVGTGAGFNYQPTVAGPLTMGTAGYNFANGSSIQAALGGTASQSAINFPGAIATAGTIRVDVFRIPGESVAVGSNDLITAVSGLLGATYTLGNVYNLPDLTLSGLTSTDTKVSIVATAATPITTAFWKGGLSGAANVWSASNGSTQSNWVATSGGLDQPLTPNALTDVTISNSTVTTAPTATTLGANMSIQSLTILDTVNGLGLNADGNNLTIGAGGITVGATVPASSIAPDVILGASQTWTNNSANDLTVSGRISGTGFGLTKEGTGTLVISGANSYTGTTAVNAGTVNMTAGTLAGSAVTVAAGATFNQASGAISGANPFTTSGATTLLGTNTFTGDVFLNGGSLTVNMTNGITGRLGSSTAPATLSKTVFMTNNAVFSNTATWDNNVGSATVLQVVFDIGSGGGTFNIAAGTTTTLNDGSTAGNANSAAQLQGTGNLTKIGDGILALGAGTSNFGTFTGQIFVNAGTLTTGATSTNPFGDTVAGTTVASGATLDIVGANIGVEPITISGTGFGGTGALISSATGGIVGGPVTLAANSSVGGATGVTFNGVISGAFGLEKVGAGAIGLSNAANAFGDITLTGGQINGNVVGGIPATSALVFNGGTLNPTNLTHPVASISGLSGSINQATAGTGVVRTTQSGNTTFNGTINRVNLTMDGTGSLTLGGTADNVAASLTVQQGTLILAKGNTAPALQAVHAVATGGLTINGGTVQLAGTYDNVNNLGTGTNLAPVGINTATYGDLIFNSVAVNLNAGTLDMNGRQEAINTLVNPSGAGGTVTNTAASTAAKLYVGHQNASSTFGGAITDGAGTVGIEKIGTGTLTLTGANTYSGPTVVTLGRLELVSNLANSSVSIGDGAILGGEVTTANLTVGVTTGGTVLFDPNSVGALTTGTLTVNGPSTLDVTSLAVPGTVSAINFTTLAGAGTFTVANAANYRVTPTVTPTASSINVTFGAGKSITWTGSASAAWDVNATQNWVDTAPAPDVFFSGDSVTFPETGANTGIALTGLLAPAGVTVNAATTAYTFTATANNQIVGPTGITKTGGGVLTLTGANAYSGQTSIGGGTVVINGTNSIGSGAAGNTIALSGGGRLSYITAAALNLGANRNITVGAGGGSISYDNAANATTTIPGNLTGSGGNNLSFHSNAAGSGTFVLTGDNSGYTGSISVDSRTGGTGGLTTLSIGNQTAAPAGGSITLNYPAGGANTNSTTLNLVGVALPAAVTVNMTSFQNGAISIRSNITSTGASAINGPITAAGNSIVQVNPATPNSISLNGTISDGIGGFTGTLFVRGTGTGVLNGQVNLPTGILAKTDPGAWTINSTGNVYSQFSHAVGTINLGADGVFSPTAPLVLGQNDVNAVTLNLNGFDQTISSLATNPVTPGANTTGKSITSASAATLTVDTSGATTYAGGINGLVSLVKDGSGTLTLAGTNATTGPTLVEDGTLVVTGSLAGSLITVNGGTLDGTGTVGDVNVIGGTLAAGTGPGILSTGGLAFSGGTAAFEIFGTTAGSGYDQLNVTGSIGFTANTTLTLDLGVFDPADDVDVFTLALNDGPDPVSLGGFSFVFAGNPLSEGEIFTASGQDFLISYAGGSGNDITLAAVPEPGSAALLLGGLLTVVGLRRRPRA